MSIIYEHPIFAPLQPALVQFGATMLPASIDELNHTLKVENMRFVPQEAKSHIFAEGYEPRIFLKQEVQIRNNCWHDFFNALVWYRFPKTKRMMNQLHYHLQKDRFPHKRRTPAEDMLTLFDENGALVVVSDPIYEQLIREHRWHELFWFHRHNLYQHLKIFILGHATYEKALQPYLGLTAKCLIFVKPNHEFCDPDALAHDYLELHHRSLSPKDLAPLPILGLPGWWPDNNSEEFYHNTDYFRPKIKS